MITATVQPTTEADDMGQLLSTNDAAGLLGKTSRRVVQLIHAGELSGQRVGARGWAIDGESVTAYLQRNGQPQRRQRGTLPAAALLDVALSRAELAAALPGAMAGAVLATAGGLLPPQLVAFAAGLTAAGTRKGTYPAGDGAEVLVTADGARLRVLAPSA